MASHASLITAHEAEILHEKSTQDLHESCIRLNSEWRSNSALPFTANVQLSALSCDKLGNRLSPELWIMIVKTLDIASAIRFSRVNRWTRHFISTMLECRRITEHGTECLFTLLRSGLANHFTIESLYSVLTMGECEQCHLFGGYVFLPTLTRCCFSCYYWNPKNMFDHYVLAIFKQKKKSHVYGQPLIETDLPVFTTPITEDKWVCQFVTREAAMKLARLNHPWLMAGGSEVFSMVGPATPFARDIQRSLIMRLPFYDVKISEADLGRYCLSCVRASARDDIWRFLPKRTREGFLEHYKKCEHAEKERHDVDDK
ncbi:hypothetical protein EV127DRAFT_499917 [Xylaria flabelliformis]|nr:hypothetical protein EV127DRAFT_499917 [Xylaria flabelliformis]